MKHFKLIVATLFIAILAACGGQAKAAPLNDKFTATDGTVFDVSHALAVEKVTGGIKVTLIGLDANHNPIRFDTAYVDSNGTVWAKFLAKSDLSTTFFRVGTSNRYIGARAAQTANCFGSSTMLGYDPLLGGESISDGCVIYQAIKAVSN